FIYKLQRRWEEAACSFQEALKCDPNLIEPYVQLSAIYTFQGRLDGALTFAQEAQQRHRKEPALRTSLGEVWANRGNVPLAIASFKVALELKPDASLVHSCLLTCLNFDPDLDSDELFAEHRRWAMTHVSETALIERQDHDWDGQRRLRIGYVSGDF